MSDDLIARLRDRLGEKFEAVDRKLQMEAADEIERLSARAEQLESVVLGFNRGPGAQVLVTMADYERVREERDQLRILNHAAGTEIHRLRECLRKPS